MFTKQILRQLFRQAAGVPFSVTYWDGASEKYGDGESKFTLIINDNKILDTFDDDFEVAFGEAYMAGRLDVVGDLADVVSAAAEVRRANLSGASNSLAVRAAASLKARTKRQQKQDVQHHYDLGNDFFKLWLDASMCYSCAYFKTPTDSLEDAQITKIDHSLNKLRLKAGESLLDIGCGWGALVMRAAQMHHARVTGITLSEQQFYHDCRSIESLSLGGLANVRVIDYEGLAREGRTFDKIVSIGMIEHVGKAHLDDFSKAVSTMLRPGGLALLHFITSPQPGVFNPWIQKYIFPGAYVPTVAEMIDRISSYDMRIIDVENLRPHYQMTLDHWSATFEQNVSKVREMLGEEFVRMWRLYLRGCSSSFRDGVLEIHQILVSNGKSDEVPLTRDDLYAV